MNEQGTECLPVAPESERVDLSAPVFPDPTNLTNPLQPTAATPSILLLGSLDGMRFRTEITLLPETKSRLGRFGPGSKPSPPRPGCWLSLVDPTSEEIEAVHLIIIRVPVDVGKEADIPHTTVRLSIVMTDGFVLTASKVPNPVVEELASGRVRSLDTARRNRFLLRLPLETGKQLLH